MLALGLLFMIVAAAVTAGALYDGGESATFEIFGQTVGTTVGGVFVAGLATMLVFLLGVWLLMRSMARSRRKRHERKETRTREQESASKIEEERARLRAENEQLQERLARGSRPAAAAPVAADTDTDRTDTGRTDEQAAPVRPSDGDRVVDRTNQTSRDEPAASNSGRHRDDV